MTATEPERCRCGRTARLYRTDGGPRCMDCYLLAAEARPAVTPREFVAPPTFSPGRWVGHCHGCGRSGREVEPRPEHYERTLCGVCAQRIPAPTPTASNRRVDLCDACAHIGPTEFSLNIDARLCDRCYWKAIDR